MTKQRTIVGNQHISLYVECMYIHLMLISIKQLWLASGMEAQTDQFCCFLLNFYAYAVQNMKQ